MATTIALPSPLDRWVDATNRGDGEAFLALFAHDGMVDDFGRRFIGRGAIRGWSDKEYIGAKGRLTVKSVEVTAKGTVVIADWASNFYTGPSRFLFMLEGEQIREMRIRGTNALVAFFLDLRRLVTPPVTSG